MSDASASAIGETPKGIAAGPVTDWLAANVAGVRPPFSFALIAGGHSNLTYCVTDAAGRKVVLRRPPLGAVLATAHDMGREHRIIASLAGSGVPVPPALGLCSDVAVNGAPFYVMAFVEGVVLDLGSSVVKHIPRLEDRRGIGRHVIEVLARLHSLDVDAIGLGDLGRREGYVPRQLKRWRTQWEQSKTRELPAMEQVYEALSSAIPEQHGSGVVHGDYRLGNMLTDTDARIAAVLDWELCTLGDPLADLGYLMNNWAEPGESGPEARGAALAPTVAGGFPSRREMLAHYRELTGRDVSQVDYYRAFSYWRLAAIVEGVLARYLKGVMGKAGDTSAFRLQVDGMAAAALERVRALGA
jgi:aminoglycoside phosphotransferase (APT) family kinase protein